MNTAATYFITKMLINIFEEKEERGKVLKQDSKGVKKH